MAGEGLRELRLVRATGRSAALKKQGRLCLRGAKIMVIPLQGTKGRLRRSGRSTTPLTYAHVCRNRKVWMRHSSASHTGHPEGQRASRSRPASAPSLLCEPSVDMCSRQGAASSEDLLKRPSFQTWWRPPSTPDPHPATSPRKSPGSGTLTARSGQKEEGRLKPQTGPPPPPERPRSRIAHHRTWRACRCQPAPR